MVATCETFVTPIYNIFFVKISRLGLPSRTNLVKLAETADVNLTWLATGIGEMDSSEDKNNTDTSESDYIHVPFFRTEASAGHGSFLDEQREPIHYLAFRWRWLKHHGFALKDLVGLVAKGDSMEPTIQDNAAIIINTSRNEVMDGKIYVIRMADRLWVKRTQWLPNNGLRLISDNKNYGDIDFTKNDLESEDIEVIGQVVHTAYDLVK